MRRQYWFVLLPIAAAAGYATFGIWGGFLAAMATIAAAAWSGWKSMTAGRPSEEERFAAFMQSAAPPPDAVPDTPVTPASTLPVAEPPRLSREAVASRALALALRSGDTALAIGLFEAFPELQDRLTLDAAAWRGLGTALLKQGAFLEAGHALHAGALASGDADAAQRRLAEAAGTAAQAGDLAAATRLYRALADRYPGAGLASFAVARVEELQRRMPSAQ